MPYDPVYSFRMPVGIREALERIARKERRSLASLILKIITDYLDDHGVAWIMDAKDEKRKFARRKLLLPVNWKRRGSDELNTAIARDISVGGLYMECRQPAKIPEWDAESGLPEIDLYIQHAMMPNPIHIPCIMTRVNVNPQTVGISVEFEKLSDTNRMLLEELFIKTA
ncbi:MAG: PilZ domain-containing protein [Deltaproteobacteria bacterium]|nr:PilZ domain-containing protein [Deltaproteobacteria bacterium]